MSTPNQAESSTSGDGIAPAPVQVAPPPQSRNKYVMASEALHKLLVESGLSREESKTLWHVINDYVVADMHTLYFSQDALPIDRHVCRGKILAHVVVKIRTWASSTCHWSDDLCSGDPIRIFAIEQKVWSLLEQAIACFKLSMDGYIRTGRHYFWLMQDRVTDPPKEWQNYLAIHGTRIAYR